LVVGGQGSGKTAFINLLANIGSVAPASEVQFLSQLVNKISTQNENQG
jgi:ABC-type lipoprotein export system ATPase subunit